MRRLSTDDVFTLYERHIRTINSRCSLLLAPAHLLEPQDGATPRPAGRVARVPPVTRQKRSYIPYINSTAFIAAVPSRSVPSDPLVGTVDVRTAATLLVLCALRFVLAPFLPTALAPIIQEGWSSRVVEDDGFKNLVTGIPVLLGRILTGWSFYFYRCCWLLSLCVFGCFFFPEPLCKFMANHGIVRLGGFAFWFLRFINLFCGYVFF